MSLNSNDPSAHQFDSAALETAIENFEVAWGKEDPPKIEDFLVGPPQFQNLVLHELIAVDLEYRIKGGEAARVEEYFKRYPTILEDDAFCVQFVAYEFQLRQRFEPQLSLAEYIQRFPQYGPQLRHIVTIGLPRPGTRDSASFATRLSCPHCHNPIALVVKSVNDEVQCPSCGSTVQLDVGQPLIERQQRHPQIPKFDLLEPVGRGAFGTVYKARDIELQRLVAIKIPRSGVLATTEDEDRFVREARNAAQLQHPGIVTVFMVGRTETYPYIVSEFVDGLTLAQSMSANRFGVRDAARLTQEISSGLQHAHEHGVIHRDLKPSNIMLTPGGVPRIMDFGFAKRDAGEITMTLDGQILGTPAYMSPEQAKGQSHDADARSDIYSVGVILFHLLTNELPFRGDVRMMLQQVIHEEPPSPRRLNDQIPRDLDTICLKCLAKDPQRRYATAEELAQDLKRFLEGQPILARPVSHLDQLWRWCCRNPTTAGLLGVAFSFLLLAAVVSFAAYIRESRLAAINAALANEKTMLSEQKSQLAESEIAARKNADAATQQARDESIRANREAELARIQSKIAKKHRYAEDLNLASVAWDEARINEVRRILERYRPIPAEETEPDDLRGFEWHYLDRLCHTDLPTLEGEKKSGVTALVFKRDAKRLVTGSRDGTVTLWDTDIGKAIWTSTSNQSEILCLALNVQTDQIACGSTDGIVRILSFETGKQLEALQGHTGFVRSVSFSSEGSRLASGANKEIKIWDCTLWELKRTLDAHTFAVESICFSADGRQMATTDGFTTKIWNRDNFTETHKFEPQRNRVTDLAYHPNGSQLAIACEATEAGGISEIRICDSATGQMKLTIQAHTGPIKSIEFAPDGKRLASAGKDRKIKLWDPATGRELSTYKGHTDTVNSVGFSSNGTLLASASDDHSVKIWDVSKLQNIVPLKKEVFTSFQTSTISAAGQRLAVATPDSSIKVWDIALGEQLQMFVGSEPPVTSLAFSKDERLLASVGSFRTVRIWENGNSNVVLGANEISKSVNDLEFHPNGKDLAVCGGNQILIIRDLKTISKLQVPGVSRISYRDLAYSPNGELLAAQCSDGKVRVWDATSGRNSLSLNCPFASSVAFRPDGKALIAAGLQTSSPTVDNVTIWDLTTGKEMAAFHVNTVKRVGYNHDGSRLLVVHDDNRIGIWDPALGQQLLTLDAAPGKLMSVAFSPDGLKLIAFSDDRNIRTWDATPRNSRPTIESARRLSTQATAKLNNGQLLNGKADMDRALALYRQLLVNTPNDALLVQEATTTLRMTGYILSVNNEFSDALRYYQHALDMLDKFAVNGTSDAALKASAAMACDGVGNALVRLERFPEALPVLLRSLQIQEAFSPDAEDLKAQHQLALTLNVIGYVKSQSEYGLDALRYFDRSLAIWMKLAAARPASELAQKNLIDQCLRSGVGAVKLYHLASGLERYRQGLAVIDAFTMATQKTPFQADAERLRTQIASTERTLSAVDSIEFTLSQEKSIVPGLLLKRIRILCAYARLPEQGLPAPIKQQRSNPEFARQLVLDAIASADKTQSLGLTTPLDLYNVTCGYCLCLDALKAVSMPDKDQMVKELQTKMLTSLKSAIEAGWTKADHTVKDPDLKFLRRMPEFQSLLNDMRAKAKTPLTP